MTWLAIKLFLGGALKRLWEAITALFGLVRIYPREAIIVALLVAFAWAWHGNTKRDRVIADWQTAAKAWQSASDANKAAAIAQVKATEAKYKQAAKENSLVEKALRADLGARNVAYADRMRADKVCRVNTPAAPSPDPAPVDNSPGPDAVVVSRADFDILAENTIRLKAANEWGQSLVKDGLAIPAVGF